MIKSLALAAMLYTPQVDSVDTEFNRAEIIITLEDMSEWMRQDVDKEGNYYWLQQISKLIALKKKIVWGVTSWNERKL